ncbi:MAG: replication-associated recombination protein A, partial [Erysipelotrichaceae bacterium]|nr:replication-associated recombination protein A [Erysipelotrichaceae bacterium]
GYQYAHDTEDKLTNMQCLPDSLKDKEYYRPTIQGLERQVAERLNSIKEWKKQHQ